MLRRPFRQGFRHVATLLALVLLAGLALPACHPTPVSAAELPAAQVPGFDISWPQCGKAYPAGPVAFAVVGINGGRPYTANPCFLEQYRWAQRVEKTPAVYVNMEFPKPERQEALTGPYGACDGADDWCRAYNYGYGIGREVTARAASLKISPSFWWLDVETGNYWTSDSTYNAQAIRGAIDFFKERSLPVGIYGTALQWRTIAGNYSPGLPIWVAGASGIEQASGRCTDSSVRFAGGTVRMVQYYDFGFDTNFACPNGHPLSQFPIADPFGRNGPSGRSFAPSGAELRHWQALPMLSSEH